MSPFSPMSKLKPKNWAIKKDSDIMSSYLSVLTLAWDQSIFSEI